MTRIVGGGGGIGGNPVCYLRGTQIATGHDEIAIEDLQIGDVVLTRRGLLRRIKWIGRSSYNARFVTGNRQVLPILITAGALADRVPKRDLYVSPPHAMFIDGLLIPAMALVNGTSVLQLGFHAPCPDTVEYFHLELNSHDVILAEGAPSESFVGDEGRGKFQNLHEYRTLYPDAVDGPARFCAPRIESGADVEAIRRRINARAAAWPDRATA